ncbi:putative endoglucanase X [Colletotrichum higginsianum]|uniref:Putative endoglucanase X n=1 Tax=Colletotrichum higginsianum TaxID=80884 RepID=A0A4T0WIT1_9PEZI|nr:putative endoglucanase X [Colletotrichum higginsianum]
MRFSVANALALVAPPLLALTAAADPLEYSSTPAGQVIKDGVKLRILPVGDSITVGFLSSDGNGYRLKLDENLSANDVVFAGDVTGGTMADGYYAAWSGRTIKYIADNVGPSLEQRPNIILLHAGTNDMNPNPDVSQEGNDPAGAAGRLGCLIDQMMAACPDAAILVAQIVNTCDANQRPGTEEYQRLIPGVVEQRRAAGHHVLAVDFAALGDGVLRDDCIHPSDEGYRTMGAYWYDFIAQIPKDWITEPVGDDPERPKNEAASANNVSGSTSAFAAGFGGGWVTSLAISVMTAVMIMSN